MKVFNLSIMLTVHLSYLLLLVSLFASVCSFPSTPLNERNQDISWEAWLLVDDQNQHRQAEDGEIPRRRITAKSVFVAPTFSPESLPPCAEGYSSDTMGRCVKIIKLDEDRHLDFLVSKLNERFGSSLDYETMLEIDEPNSEPTRLDIPLSLDYGDDYSNDTPQAELDMAIIVTPTTRESEKPKGDDSSKLGKRDDNHNEDIYEEELKKLLKLSTTNVEDATLIVKTEQSTTDESESMTAVSNTQRIVAEETSTQEEAEVIRTSTVATTTGKYVEETTILSRDSFIDSTIHTKVDTTTSTDASPTTTLENTTVLPTTITTTIEADSTETATTPDSRITTKITTTTPKITTYHPIATTYHPYFDLSLLGSDSRTKNLVKFPDEEHTIPRSHPDGSYVRFPDVNSKYQQESLAHHTRNVDEQTGNFFNEIVTPQPSQRVHELVLPPSGMAKAYFSTGFYPKFFPSQDDPGKSHAPPVYQLQTATTERRPIKKAKEKYGSFVQFPQKWSSEEYHHKPIVLRSLPMDDLTYLFGYKNGHTSHR